MALQLRMPFIELKRTNTALIFLQCIHQAKLPCNGVGTIRPSYQLASNIKLAYTLLEILDNALQRIRENWESLQALRVFVAIARRLLLLNFNESMRIACLNYLSLA